VFDRDDIVIDDRFLDTPDRRGNDHGFYSSFGSERHHHHHLHHPYWRSLKKYLPKEFEKENHPTFDGELKKSQDPEPWLLGMNKFFKLHDYS